MMFYGKKNNKILFITLGNKLGPQPMKLGKADLDLGRACWGVVPTLPCSQWTVMTCERGHDVGGATRLPAIFGPC